MLGPVITGVVVGVFIPSAFVEMFYWTEGKQQQEASRRGIKRWLTFEPVRQRRDEMGNVHRLAGEYIDFKPILGHYIKCAEVLITLSSASLIFIPSLHLNSKVPWLALPLILLGFTVVTALAFMGLIVFFYEEFLEAPRSFTALRYAINHGLGFGSLALFALSYFLVAIFVGVAVSNGATLSIHV